MTELLLRPRSASELLDAAFRLLRRHYKTYLLVSAIGYAPQLLVTLLQYSMLDGMGDEAAVQAMGQGVFFFGAVMGLALIVLYMLWWATIEGVYAAVTSSAYHTGEASLRDALARALPRAPAVIGTALFVGLICMVGFVFLVIPGIYLACRLYTSLVSTVLDEGDRGERVGPTDATNRTWERTNGRALHVFKTMFLAFLVFFVLMIGAGMISGIGAAMAGGSSFLLLVSLLTGLITILVYPLIPIVSTLLYYDLRIRNEGYDLEAQVAGIGGDVGVAGGQLPPPPARLRVR